jgi:hypothetical protein
MLVVVGLVCVAEFLAHSNCSRQRALSLSHSQQAWQQELLAWVLSP